MRATEMNKETEREKERERDRERERHMIAEARTTEIETNK